MRLAIVASLIVSVVTSASADIITFENTITRITGICEPWEEIVDISLPFTLNGSIQFPIVPTLGDEFGWHGAIPFHIAIRDTDVTDRLPKVESAFNAEPRLGEAHIGAIFFSEGSRIGGFGLGFSQGTLETFPPEIDLTSGDFLMTIERFGPDEHGELNDCQFQGPVTRLEFVQTGDANFDGLFNTTDLIQVFQAGEYENNVVADSTWETGDWTGDGEFDSQDLTVALQRGTFGGTAGTAPVPEPGCLFLPAVGIMLIRSQSNQRPTQPATV